MTLEKDVNEFENNLWALEKKKIYRMKIAMLITYFIAIVLGILYIFYGLIRTSIFWVNALLYYGSIIPSLVIMAVSIILSLIYSRYLHNYRIILFLKMGKKIDQLLFILTNEAKIDKRAFKRKQLALAALEDLGAIKIHGQISIRNLSMNSSLIGLSSTNHDDELETTNKEIEKVALQDLSPYKDSKGHYYSLFAYSKEYFSENISVSTFAFGLLGVVFLALGLAKFLLYGFDTESVISPITWIIFGPFAIIEILVIYLIVKRSINKIELLKEQKDYLGLLDKASKSNGLFFSFNALSAIGALGDLGIIASIDGLEQLLSARSKYVRYFASTAIDMILVKNDLPKREFFHL